MATLTFIFFSLLVEVSRKVIVELEEREIKAEGKLCEALAHASKVELAFREERDRANALSHSSIHAAIKLGKMHLWVTKVQKRETQIVKKVEVDIANLKGDYWIILK